MDGGWIFFARAIRTHRVRWTQVAQVTPRPTLLCKLFSLARCSALLVVVACASGWALGGRATAGGSSGFVRRARQRSAPAPRHGRTSADRRESERRATPLTHASNHARTHDAHTTHAESRQVQWPSPSPRIPSIARICSNPPPALARRSLRRSSLVPPDLLPSFPLARCPRAARSPARPSSVVSVRMVSM